MRSGFGHERLTVGWWAQVNRHSLGWVCARAGDRLVGFVNVAWDGDVHAFVLDTLVVAEMRRHGIGRQLVALATERARAAGCEWLHVDFEPHLREFLSRGLRLPVHRCRADRALMPGRADR